MLQYLQSKFNEGTINFKLTENPCTFADQHSEIHPRKSLDAVFQFLCSGQSSIKFFFGTTWWHFIEPRRGASFTQSL